MTQHQSNLLDSAMLDKGMQLYKLNPTSILDMGFPIRYLETNVSFTFPSCQAAGKTRQSIQWTPGYTF